MPLAPDAMQVSTAATWVSVSPSTLPAKVCSVMPSSSALAAAPSLHLDEEGIGVGLGDQAGAGLGHRRRDREGGERHGAQHRRRQ